MHWYLTALRKYATFGGRARRREYWMFALVNFAVCLALGLVDAMGGTFDADAGIGVLGGLYAFGVLLPNVAVSVRRLHDTDRSGWWLLLGLIPILGAILLIVFATQDGRPGANRFGANPKVAAA